MPVLPEPSKARTVPLPARVARVAARTDVLVVGGGPAGIGAAIGASRAGAKTVLVERYGFLGGSPTASLVMPMASYYTHSDVGILPPRFALFPKDHGKGYPVAAGVLAELVDRLVKSNGGYQPVQQNGYTVPFDPEVYKLVCIDMLDEAGVHVLLHSFACSYLPGTPQGVVFETKSGPIVIQADYICDCTGDGDIAAWAGAEYAVGRVTDGYTQPMSLLFRVADFNKARFKEYTHSHAGEWDGVRGLWELIRKAAGEGKLNLPREDILFFGSIHPREVDVNSTRVTKAIGINVFDLTRGEWESHKQVREIHNFMKEYVPGFESSFIGASGNNISVRETRRIVGDYVLSKNDVLKGKKFEDAIARSTYPIDEHNPGGKGTLLKDVPYNDYYEIPMRCLLPRKLDRVLTAGRCISGTHLALSSYRVIPISMITGQASGVCAAVAAQNGLSIHKVPYERVREELLKQGAMI